MPRARAIPMMYFPTLELREHSRLLTEREHPFFNIAYPYAEAELFVISKLREGQHPGVLEEIINTAKLRSEGDDYRMKFLEFCIRILHNLLANKLLDYLISTQEYDMFVAPVWQKLTRFEVAIAEICAAHSNETLLELGMDEEIRERLLNLPELDKEAEECLKYMWALKGAEANLHYEENTMLLESPPLEDE